MTLRQDRSNLHWSPYQIAGLAQHEYWRPVVGFIGYHVSNHGRVCSVDRVVNGKKCHGRVLRSGVNSSGHYYVFLGRGNRKQVHVLVLESFVGPCPTGHEGLHFDDNPDNNVLTNLRWGTRSDNLHDAVRNGKVAIGEAKPQAKLTEDRVRWIRANAQFSMNSLAMQLGVSCAAVKQVLDGKTWKHVT